MKSYLLLLIVGFTACKTIKIPAIVMNNPTQPLVGNIKNIHSTKYSYDIKEKDTTIKILDLNNDYDSNNVLIKQIEKRNDMTIETNFNYFNNGSLKSEVTTFYKKNDTLTFKTEYIYDENKNNVALYCFRNNDTTDRKTFIYDKHNNLIEEQFTSANKVTFFSKILINYNNKTSTLKASNSMNQKEDDISWEICYNKNGGAIKIEMIDKEKKDNYIYCINKYDEMLNITKTIKYDNREKDTTVYDYKYAFDEMGNIKLKEVYIDNILLEKFVCNIKYDSLRVGSKLKKSSNLKKECIKYHSPLRIASMTMMENMLSLGDNIFLNIY